MSKVYYDETRSMTLGKQWIADDKRMEWPDPTVLAYDRCKGKIVPFLELRHSQSEITPLRNTTALVKGINVELRRFNASFSLVIQKIRQK